MKQRRRISDRPYDDTDNQNQHRQSSDVFPKWAKPLLSHFKQLRDAEFFERFPGHSSRISDFPLRLQSA
jgi:hypothetical protein